MINTDLSVVDFRELALRAPDPLHSSIPLESIHTAILIREVEMALLGLFSLGLLNGTVHTCVGQEFSAALIAGRLLPHDWVSSNHRGHGHFIAKTGNWRGLIDEVMGLESGVCKGIGSSQHLFSSGFLSNGVLGSLVPVATGIALHLKRTGTQNLAVSFIGEGTLGEGVLYEAMNLAALWELPQLFVCENNLYCQSTPQWRSIAGTVAARAHAFGIRTFEANTWDLEQLASTALTAIAFVREATKPAMLVVRTYRLNAHSKGDDLRDTDEIRFFGERDPLHRLVQDKSWHELQLRIRGDVAHHIESTTRKFLAPETYLADQLPRHGEQQSRAIHNEDIRLVAAMNRSYRALVERGVVVLGEDICDPYGGAFKVTRGLSTSHPDNIYAAPISEAGITGVGTGLALLGTHTLVEIMFGDFMTNILDQLVNNISKMHHMYAGQASVPIRIRTPMGGKLGYGPTHSQSLEKLFLGIDNLTVIALTSVEDPREALTEVDALRGPALIIESKIGYARRLWQGSHTHATCKVNGGLGTIVLSPLLHEPTLTVVSYGETAREIADSLADIFIETDAVIELVIPVLLHPLDLRPLQESTSRTHSLLCVEEASVHFGVGAEIIASLVENNPRLQCWRLGAAPVPIPSATQIERYVLPSVHKLVDTIKAIQGSVPCR